MQLERGAKGEEGFKKYSQVIIKVSEAIEVQAKALPRSKQVKWKINMQNFLSCPRLGDTPRLLYSSSLSLCAMTKLEKAEEQGKRSKSKC